MKQAWLHRLISTLTIIALIVVALMLINQLQHLFADLESGSRQTRINLMSALLILFGIILYILNLQRPVKEIIREKIVEKTITVSEKEESTEVQKENEIDQKEIEGLVQKIIPNDKDFQDAETYTEKILSNLSKEFEVVQGVIFLKDSSDKIFKPSGKYAYHLDSPPTPFKEGESIPGQVAKNKTPLMLDEIPDGYITVLSGLGNAHPRYMFMAPILRKDGCTGIIEIASFKKINKKLEATVLRISELISDKFVEHN